MITDVWEFLDDDARTNLNEHDLAAFFRYKEDMKASGASWEGYAYETLVGFIWSCTEEYEDDQTN